MGQLLVPEWATQSKESFREWFCLIYSQLYEQPVDNRRLRKHLNFYPPEERIKIAESIMQRVNLVLYGKNVVPEYKEKKKKVNCKIGDVLCITAYVLKTQFTVTLQDIATLFSCKSHCTILYYVRNHKGRCETNRRYRTNYENLLKILRDERLIPIVEETQSDSKRILPAVLS
jgi:chromosomal replication initiation ATPase DnaA